MWQCMSRNDFVGMGMFDSIKWIFETHVKEPDNREFNFAVLHGNEDAPSKIELWRDANPQFDETPDRVWMP